MSWIVALLLSAKFQRHLTRQVLELERTANIVTDKKDYSQRALKICDDDWGF